MEPLDPPAGGTAADGQRGGDSSLTPTLFVWPYGGTKVFLTGSFTGWSRHMQMMPVEGRPTVFQTVHRLTRGVHMYKFIVDGEWLHDEHQPSATSRYGIVNTIQLPTQPGLVSTSTDSGTSVNGSNMDVDSKSFQAADIYYGVPDTDLEISRHHVSNFLSAHSAYNLLPDSGKVIALDVKLPVKQAFHVLYEQGIPVAPLLDFDSGQFVGMLTALDFILILKELGSHSTSLTEEELESHTISAWKEGKHKLGFVGQKASFWRNLIFAGPYDPLKDVALKILQNEVATVPIIFSDSGDESFPQLLHVASLSGILKCICRHFQHSSSLLPILQYPVSAFPLGTWVPKIGESNGRPLARLKPTASLNTALSMLVEAQVSSLPIVDDNDSLLDVYSRSDITTLAKDKAYAKIHLEETTIHQALQHGQDATSPRVLASRQRMCLRSDPLFAVMERLSKPGVRQLIVVEAGSMRVEGIISLSDIFRILLGS